jgi:hypothetical protein
MMGDKVQRKMSGSIHKGLDLVSSIKCSLMRHYMIMIYAGHLELFSACCDVTAESRNSVARTRRPLLSNVSVPFTTHCS